MRAAGAEHFAEEPLGADVLDFGEGELLGLLGVEAVADCVVDECHEAGGDDDAGRVSAGMFELCMHRC